TDRQTDRQNIIRLFQYVFGYVQVRLNDIGTLTRGKRFVKADSVEEGTPCIHYGELYTYYGVWAKEAKSHLDPELASKIRFAKQNDVVIVGAGENDWDIGVGVAWLGNEKVAVHDACYIYEHDQNPKYISYCLRTTDYHNQKKKYVSTGKICAISSEGLGQAIIYLPSIEKQREIVEKLDAFDVLTKDISDGIPAEIEARQKQYEYYRDKLLDFKRL
ncbi:MAG: restriction endonuclease subunit S, partial [Erysipelotrichaceae bacterium]|nr:restriction endonuclease subunit S [Erysipelotrichaceae bacterium]